jgi:predicted permease
MTSWTQELRDRLARLSLRPEREAEIIEELSQHLDDQVRERVAGGMDVSDARREALADLDQPGALARRLAETETRAPLSLPAPGAPARGRWFHQFWQDVRLALRSFRRRPWFSISVLATLALTIGPTTAIVSVGNWLLWTPSQAVTEPGRLVVIWSGTWRESGGMSPSGVSYANLDDLRAASRTLSGLAGWQESGASIAVPGATPRQGQAGFVTANFFDVLGLKLAAGRAFTNDEDMPPFGQPVTVISHSLAVQAFGTPQQALDQTVHISGRPMKIVGVAPRSFGGASPTSQVDVWYPGGAYAYVNHYTETQAQRFSSRSSGLFYTFIGRLAAGRSWSEAQAELDTLMPLLAESYPSDNDKFKTARARVFPGLGPSELQRASLDRQMRGLLMVAAVLLLLGCANVSNLLLSEGVRARAERAVRLALGASRGRLIRQLLTESVTLAALGAVAGIGLAFWLKGAIQAWWMPGISVMASTPVVPIDRLVLAVTIVVAVSCGVLAGLAPAWLGTRGSLQGGLVLSGSRGTTGSHRMRTGLAALQLALSMVLVSGAALLVTTVRNIGQIDPGFDADSVILQHVALRGHGYTPPRAMTYSRQLAERLRADAAVESLTIATGYPLGYTRIESLQTPGGGEKDTTGVRRVATDAAYVDVLGLQLRHGRYFRSDEVFSDTLLSDGPVVISESLARTFFGRDNAVGERITASRTLGSPAREFVIVGVMRETAVGSVTEAADPLIYYPITQDDFATLSSVILAKTRGTLARFADVSAAAAVELDPTLPLGKAWSLSSWIDRDLATHQMFARVLSLLGGVAMVLAAVGLFGLLAQAVGERRREFGIRMAIGATGRRIAGLVLRQAAWACVWGIAGGLALSYWGSGLVTSYLWGVSTSDPRVYAVTITLLLVVVALAAARPAWLATRVNPIEALRSE